MMSKGNSQIFPVYLLYGPEDYLMEEEVQKLLNQTLSQHLSRSFWSNDRLLEETPKRSRKGRESGRILPVKGAVISFLDEESDEGKGENPFGRMCELFG